MAGTIGYRLIVKDIPFDVAELEAEFNNLVLEGYRFEWPVQISDTQIMFILYRRERVV